MKAGKELVIAFLAKETRCPMEKITLDSSIPDDLGIAGDNADEMFRAFEKRFGIDTSRLNLDRYFGKEGMWPWEIVFLIFIILLGILRYLCGMRFFRRRNPADDMKVADLVQAVEDGHFSNEFEQARTRRQVE